MDDTVQCRIDNQQSQQLEQTRRQTTGQLQAMKVPGTRERESKYNETLNCQKNCSKIQV